MLKFMVRQTALKTLVALFFLFTAVIAWSAPELRVVSASPKGKTNQSGRVAINVSFNQPVAALAEASAFSSEDCPLTISPKVNGTCRYNGTQALVFEPAEDLTRSTTYDVTVKAGFKSAVSGQALGQDYNFSFQTRPFAVESTRPYKNELWMTLNPTLYVIFNMPPDMKTMKDSVRLEYGEPVEKRLSEGWFGSNNTITDIEMKSVPVRIRPITDEEFKQDFDYYDRNRVVAIQPAENLKIGTEYTLTLMRGMKPAVGTDGLAQDYQLLFYTYPELTVKGNKNEGCLPYTPEINFSSPVRLSELIKHIKISPESAKSRTLKETELNSLGYESKPGGPETAHFRMPLNFLDLKAKQDVTVTVDGDLKDIFGNKLGETYTFTIRNEGYCPAAKFSGGFGVIESYLPLRHPVDLMNTPDLRVSAARFSKQNFIPFDKRKNSRYCEETKLTDPSYSGVYSFSDVTDKTIKSFLDLEKFKPTTKDSIIFSQVRIPNENRDNGYCWSSATDNITDIGITLKTSPTNILLWATSLKTGEVMPNLPVELRNVSNKVLWTGTTDMNGVAMAPGWKDLDVNKVQWGRPEIYAFVSSPGGDAVLSSNWNQGLDLWRFNLNYEYTPSESTHKTVLFTERSIYRPGETVYLKGVLRSREGGEWTLPKVKKGALKVFNARGEDAFNETVEISQNMGTFNAQIPLPKGAYTGYWDVSFTPEGLPPAGEDGTGSVSFRVEAVKQSDFEVNLRPDKENYISGENASFMASANYMFGAPVADGNARWTVRQSDGYVNIKGFSEYVFAPYFMRQDASNYGADKLLVESTGKLDGKGTLNFKVKLPEVKYPAFVYTEMGVQSPSRQELFNRQMVTVHPSSFYIGTKLETKNGVKLGEAVKAGLIAVTPEGVKLDNIKTDVKIWKEQWLSVRKSALNGRLEWISEKQITDFAPQKITINEEGTDFVFMPSEEGSYFVTFTAKDDKGRVASGGLEFYVYGPGQTYWRQNDDDILNLKQDKDVYQVGDTAKILVESPYEEANALVTVEREGVLDSWITPVRSGADYVEVPVKADYLPNAYVSVMLVRGRSDAKYDESGLDLAKPQGKIGYANLTVEQTPRRITTAIQTDKKEYRPGEEVTVKLDTAVRGKPTAAEVVVMVVDEGLLALGADQTPDLMKQFYGSRPIAVGTADNRMFVIGQRNFGEKGENRGGGGSADSKLGGVDLRTNFQFTPYYNAVVKTDAKGRAELKFKLPDNLTDFRIMAVALTEREFGSGETNIKVSKPIMITPSLPRFVREGDAFECGAVIHNYEDKKGNLKVTARATGSVVLIGGKERAVKVDKGTAKEISWKCAAGVSGPGEVAFSVKGGRESDGVAVKFPVLAIEKKQTLSLYSSTSDKEEQLLVLPKNVNEVADNRVEASMASTALLNLKGAMLYLISYPYDCLEQKMSKILPVISGAQLMEDFGLGKQAELKKQVQDILDGIADYQYSSGGYAYWTNAKPDPYLTAYVLEVAARAKEKGYRVNQASLDKAANWLLGALSKNPVTAYRYSALENKTTRAYSVYVLAYYGKAVQSHFNNLYNELNALPLSARTYLLKAAAADKKVSQAQRERIAQSIINSAVYSSQTMHFASAQNMPWLHMSDAKVTALALEALIYAGSDMVQPYRVVRWLTNQLNKEGHWNNTNVNAAVFNALDAYYRKFESDVPDFTAQLTVNTVNLMQQSFKGRSLAESEKQFPFTQFYAKGPDARVTISKKGSGTLFYTLSQVYAPKSYTEPLSAGFTVSRTVVDMKGDKVKHFKAGQRYKVMLQVESVGSRHFVVLEDFIPSGFEIVNTSLANESRSDAVGLNDYAYGSFERDEKYDDRIAVFADYLNKGKHSFTYLVQATIPGDFSYPSVWASQMYEPATFGRSATQQIKIVR